MLKVLQANEDYDKQVIKYTKKDGILAFVLFGVTLLQYSAIALLQIQFDFINNNFLLAGCVVNLCLIGITILFVKRNNEKIDTIGLYKGKWRVSCIIGIIYAGILFFNNCLLRISAGGDLLPAREIIILAVYYLLVSLSEEIVFRGYIGTRIFGLVKKKWLAVIIVGMLFIMMHFPYRMIAYGMSIGDLTINNLSWILDLFITHVILNFIYMKTNSLYGSIIPHWISNLANNIIFM